MVHSSTDMNTTKIKSCLTIAKLLFSITQQVFVYVHTSCVDLVGNTRERIKTDEKAQKQKMRINKVNRMPRYYSVLDEQVQ